MEREKQKQIEKEQLKQQREAILREQQEIKRKPGDENENPMKSKFVSVDLLSGFFSVLS